ncbi:hypothetical protein [Dolichospermum sp. UHCC 0259]|uniref:hypothetical protein n=1 Tax=Dolichospermum sp. UHCC 0259 TaxID=2590010 RepID=UPI001448236C|nr:hypothetical protein [Dolichospermum sp. UHCC 0259]
MSVILSSPLTTAELSITVLVQKYYEEESGVRSQESGVRSQESGRRSKSRVC